MSRFALTSLSLAVLLAGSAYGQEYVLKNGRRIPAERVKASGESFSAVLPATGGSAPENVNFAVKDLASVSNLPEPVGLRDGRRLLTLGKPAEARIQLEAAVKETADLKTVPGSEWSNAVIALMDAQAALGKPAEANALASADNLTKVPPETASRIKEMATIVTSKSVEAVKDVATSTIDSWILARARLRMAELLSGEGKLEDAVTAYLRVPVFSAPEKDLAFRAYLSAARGLQQIQRAEDGVKLLDDYLADNPPASYRPVIEAEKSKLIPPKKDDPKSASEPKSESTPEEKKDQTDSEEENN